MSEFSRKLAIFSLLLFTGFCLLKAGAGLFSGDSDLSLTEVEAAVPARITEPRLQTTPIQQMRPGMRVLGRNPDRWDTVSAYESRYHQEALVMPLEQTDKIDALGLESETGCAVLTIADSWHWDDEREHLSALQEKLNAYFEFIESGQVWESYPAATGRQLRINVVFRFRPPAVATEFLAKAAAVASELNVLVSHETFSGTGSEE